MASSTKGTAPLLSIPDQIVAHVAEKHCVVLHASQKVVGIYHNCNKGGDENVPIFMVDVQKIPAHHDLKTLPSYLQASNCLPCKCKFKEYRLITTLPGKPRRLI